MGSWRELFPTGLSKKQCAHKPWSGREGNKSVYLKVLNYFFSLSFPCPHWSISRCAKGGNVLMAAGVSGTESFSHSANKPGQSAPKTRSVCTSYSSSCRWEMLGEKSDHSAAASSCLSCDPAVHPGTTPLASSCYYLLWQGPSAGPRARFFCSSPPCRGSRLTANAVYSAHFIPRWKAARPEVKHGKHFAMPGNSTQLLKTSGEKSSVQTQGHFHIGRM